MATTSHSNLISLSVVSHGQATLVAQLLNSLERWQPVNIELILTINIPETLPVCLRHPTTFSFPIRMIYNSQPRGFGANHNTAVQQARGQWVCILNPDMRFLHYPFPVLLQYGRAINKLGIIAPQVITASEQLEDSARAFPTPLHLMKKALGINRDRVHLAHQLNAQDCCPMDWVAGMFMLMPREVFLSVGGFDPCYYLYYEDVDLCARLRRAGWSIMITRHATIIHTAQRASHRYWRYRWWHIHSALRFFRRYYGGRWWRYACQ